MCHFLHVREMICVENDVISFIQFNDLVTCPICLDWSNQRNTIDCGKNRNLAQTFDWETF
jgi:hypothetical protein